VDRRPAAPTRLRRCFGAHGITETAIPGPLALGLLRASCPGIAISGTRVAIRREPPL